MTAPPAPFHARPHVAVPPPPAAATPAAPQTSERAREQATERHLTHASLCCGIGGWEEGFAQASKLGLHVNTVLAVDNCAKTCDAYRETHPTSAAPQCMSFDDPRIIHQLRKLRPHLTTSSTPCTDCANGEGVVQEGEAAELTYKLAKVVTEAELELVLSENVPQMLKSQAWGRGKAHLLANGYAVLETVIKASELDTCCRRTRALVLIVRNRFGVKAALQRLCAVLNAMCNNGIPLSMRHVLKVPRRVRGCFLRPRVRSSKGVHDLDGLFGSPTRRWPGLPPVNPAHYIPSPDDACDVRDAMTVTPRDMALMLTYRSDLPTGSQEQLQLWLANLVMPDVAHAFLLAAWCSGIFDMQESSPSDDGFAMSLDRNSPTPEWLADSTAALEHTDGTASRETQHTLVQRCINAVQRISRDSESTARAKLSAVDLVPDNTGEQESDTVAAAPSFLRDAAPDPVSADAGSDAEPMDCSEEGGEGSAQLQRPQLQLQ